MMKTYEVKKIARLTVHPGSVVVLTDEQAAAASSHVAEVKQKAPKKGVKP